MSDWTSWFPPLADGQSCIDELHTIDASYMLMLIHPAHYETLLDFHRPSRRWKRVYLRVSKRRARWPHGPWRRHRGRSVINRPPYPQD